MMQTGMVDPMMKPGSLVARDFNVMRGGWNFFDDVFRRIQIAQAEMAAMRNQMFSLMPQDVTDMSKMMIQPMGREFVEEQGQTKMKLEFDVHQFKPEDIKVKVLENNILEVEADHEERSDTGFRKRTFHRHYTMPKGVDTNSIHPSLTNDGVLIVEANASGLQPSERMIPIEHKKEVEK